MTTKIKAWQAKKAMKQEIRQLTDKRKQAIEDLKKIDRKILKIVIDNEQ